MIFLINPMAGKGNDIENFKNIITETAQKLGRDYEIYVTKAPCDAEEYVRIKCSETTEPIACIACGGDGTFNEVVNGVYGYENAIAGVFPSGTGNDFCRNFPDADFKDISAQFNGIVKECDVICYKGIINGKEVTKYCANMFNVGFDCNVADTTAKLKKYPLIKGPLAYFLSIFVMLIKKKGADIRLEIDGKEIHNGKLLLTAIANGKCCGGGIKSNPYAITDDGLMDVNIIKDIPRYLFIPCLPKYMKGTLFDTDKYAHIASAIQCKNVVIIPNSKLRLCVDGEIYDAEKIEFSIISKGIKFLIPTNNDNHYQKERENKNEKSIVSG